MEATVERLRREMASLRSERQRLRNIIDVTGTGTWEWNIQSGELVVNDCWAEQLGYRLEEISPVTLPTFNGLIHPDDHGRVWETVARCFRGELARYECEIRLRHKNGQWVCVLDQGNVASWTGDGEPLWMVGTHTDITGRKRIEDELRSTKERLEATISALPDLMFRVDRDGRFHDFRSSFIDDLYVSPDLFLGKRVEDVLPGETAAIIMSALDEAARQGAHRGATYSLPMPQGERWFELSIAPMGEASHPETHFIVLARDITERTRMEELRSATIKLLNICNGASERSALADGLTRFFRTFSGCEDVSIRLREENGCYPVEPGSVPRQCPAAAPVSGARGSYWTNSFPELHAGSDPAGVVPPPVDHSLGGGGESMALVPLSLKDETLGIIRFSDRRPGLFTPEKIARLEELVSYATIAFAKLKSDEELRETTRFYQQVIDSAHEGIIVYDRDLSYQLWNPYMQRHSGRTAEEVIGRQPREVFPFLEEGGVLELMERALRGQTTLNHIFRHHHPATGRICWASESTGPLRNSRGEVVGVISVVRDMTEAKLHEEQILEQQHRLTELAFELQIAEERERARIAGELHDRVGQSLLLGKIKLGMLARQIPSGAAAAEIEQIIDLLETSIHDIRSLTFQMRPPLLATSGLVAAARNLCKELQEDYGLEIRFADDGAAKPLRYEVRSALFQAVRELLINIAKHSGTRSGALALLRTADGVVITVTDEGCGFAPEVIAGRSPRTGGFGLFNVQQKIEYLGGCFALRTAPGEGTVITITYPLDGE